MSIHTDIIGLMAGFFVILAFHSQQPKPLRIFAIGSNILFIVYGALAEVMPVLVLHAILLPLNIIRMIQLSEVSILKSRKWDIYWRSTLGIMLVCVAAVLWATVGIASQMMDATIDPALAELVRTVAGSVFILMFMLRTDRPIAQDLDKGILPLLAFGVFCGCFKSVSFRHLKPLVSLLRSL